MTCGFNLEFDLRLVKQTIPRNVNWSSLGVHISRPVRGKGRGASEIGGTAI